MFYCVVFMLFGCHVFLLLFVLWIDSVRERLSVVMVFGHPLTLCCLEWNCRCFRPILSNKKPEPGPEPDGPVDGEPFRRSVARLGSGVDERLGRKRE